MSYINYRKCAKCGRTRLEDMSVTYHRFPRPGPTNLIKARAWATYCWPKEDWTSIEAMRDLHKSNKVLCGRHFKQIQFCDDNRQKLSKYAVPDSTEVAEILNKRDNVFNESLNPQEQSSVASLKERASLTQIENYIVQPSPSTTQQSPVQQVLVPTTINTCENLTPAMQGQSGIASFKLQRASLSQIGNYIVQPSPSTSKQLPVQQVLVPTINTCESLIPQGQSGIANFTLQRASLTQIENYIVQPSPSITKQSPVQQVLVPTTINTCEMSSMSVNLGEESSKKTASRTPILSQLNITRLSEMTPRELIMYNICRKKTRQIAKLRKQLKSKKEESKQLFSKAHLQKLCKMDVSNLFLSLLQSQLQNCPRKLKGRRYNSQQKMMALVIYKKSPECYRLLQKMFALPSQTTLNQLLKTPVSTE